MTRNTEQALLFEIFLRKKLGFDGLKTGIHTWEPAEKSLESLITYSQAKNLRSTCIIVYLDTEKIWKFHVDDWKEEELLGRILSEFFLKDSAKIKYLTMEGFREKPSSSTDENIESLQFVKIKVRKGKLFSERFVIFNILVTFLMLDNK